jgi:hypothetical protein
VATLRAASIIYSDEQLIAALLGLSLTGYVDLYQAARDGFPYPPLYSSSGVRYKREPPGSEVWQIPQASFASLDADCEDLCAGWRVPLLWLYGETAAMPYVRRINPRLRHILVERADGTIEDPSLILGMHDRSDKSEGPAALRLVKPLMPTPSVLLPFRLPSIPVSQLPRYAA